MFLDLEKRGGEEGERGGRGELIFVNNCSNYTRNHHNHRRGTTNQLCIFFQISQ